MIRRMASKTAAEMYELYQIAEIECLAGKRSRVGDRWFETEDLDQIRKGRQEWGKRMAAEDAGVILDAPSGGFIDVSFH